jgi:hypothetical protein
MRILGLIFIGLASTDSLAQVAIKNPATEIQERCVAEAVSANEVRTSDDQTFYSCFGATAKSWFDISTNEKVVRDKNGIFIARYYGETGYCAHQIEDGAGKASSAYICEIVKTKPK